MIHRTLNNLAISSGTARVITFALSSQLAYVLVAWAAISLYLHESQQYIILIGVSFGAAVIARLIVEGIYVFYKRPRPSSTDGITPLFTNTNPSFPSGHATFFGALATSLLLLQTPLALGFGTATCVLCVARVAAGVHFFSDIVGGLAVGVGTTLILFFSIGLY